MRREIVRVARLTRRLGKLPKGAIVPVGAPFSRTRRIVRYRDRKTGQLVSGPRGRPKPIRRHPRKGIFITKTEDTLLAKRRQRMTRPDALRWLRASPKSKTYLDGLPRGPWQGRLVRKTLRGLRRGLEPRQATAKAIKETVREVRFIRERRGEDVRGLSARQITTELRDLPAPRPRRRR